MQEIKPKSFWKRPEGKTGTIFGLGLLGLGAYGLVIALPAILAFAQTVLGLIVTLSVLAAVVYVLLDSRFRNLLWYGYKSVMRFITSVFVQIDPIGIIESYIDDLKNNLKKMGKQISNLRGQMRKLKTMMEENEKNMDKNMRLASQAKQKGKDSVMVLKSRKAGRLRESNLKLNDLYKKMEVLYRVLTKMYGNSEILLEDIQDEVMIKKREREAIKASHSAMHSARNIIMGNKDKRQLFDQAMESIADDVGKKVGEMEQFMEMSSTFMDSIDLQNGVFEEEGLAMLEKWEKEGISSILGDEKGQAIKDAENENVELDLDAPIVDPEAKKGHKNQYSDLFDF